MPPPALRSAPTVDDACLEEISHRLSRTRYTNTTAHVHGVPTERVAALVKTWQQDFDWRDVERWQHDFGAAITETPDGRRLHFLHRSPVDPTLLPVLLLHGWPDSPLQFRRLAPLLLDAGHPVVAPSAAGFSWSDETDGELSASLVAQDVALLMASLGHDRYVVHGTDWGASVAAALAEHAADSVAGLHLLQPPFDRAFQVDRQTATEAEMTYLTTLDRWGESASYISAHMHQADTLAVAFADSPAGLLAWLTDQYDRSSTDGLDDHHIIATTAEMWLTGTFRSSIRLYSEPSATWDEGDWSEEGDTQGPAWDSRIEVPTAFALFPNDIGRPPREFCERFFAVSRFTHMARGGHWGALEEPTALAADIVSFSADIQ